MLRAGVAMLALWAGPQVDGHVHRAPHSGVIAHAGAHHVEMVVKDETIEIWLLDQQEQVVTPPAGSRVTLTLNRAVSRPVKGAKVVALGVQGDHFESAFGLEPLGAFTARVDLALGEKKLRARIKWTMLDLRHRLDDGMKLELLRPDDDLVDSLSM